LCLLGVGLEAPDCSRGELEAGGVAVRCLLPCEEVPFTPLPVVVGRLDFAPVLLVEAWLVLAGTNTCGCLCWLAPQPHATAIAAEHSATATMAFTRSLLIVLPTKF
jgi:hypothetical protein